MRYNRHKRGGDGFRHVTLNKLLADRSAIQEVAEPLLISNHLVAKLLYESEMPTMYQYGFKPKEIAEWTQSLASGEIPSGFESIEIFEAYVVKRLTERTKKNGKT